MPKLYFTLLLLLALPVSGAQVGVFTLTDFSYSQVAYGGAALPPASQIITRMYPDHPSTTWNAWVEWYSMTGWHTMSGQEIDLDFSFRVAGPSSMKVTLSDSDSAAQFSFTGGMVSYRRVITGSQGYLGPAFGLSSDVPEPSTWLACLTGCALLIFARRRSAAQQ